MTTTQTIAEQIADTLDLDARDRDGIGLPEIADKAGAHRVTRGQDLRFDFPDGSAIIVSHGQAWDVRHPDCTCGWCWQGGGSRDRPQCLAD